MTALSIKVTAAAVQKALDQYAGKERVRRALGALGRVLVTRIKLGFQSGTAPHGAPWRPLVLRAGQPLLDTGRLRNSITSKIDGDRVLVGTNLTYSHDGKTWSAGRVHQFGATVLPVKAKMLRVPFGGSVGGAKPKGFLFLEKAVIPARPFMPLNKAGNVDLPESWKVSALNAMAAVLEL